MTSSRCWYAARPDQSATTENELDQRAPVRFFGNCLVRIVHGISEYWASWYPNPPRMFLAGDISSSAFDTKESTTATLPRTSVLRIAVQLRYLAYRRSKSNLLSRSNTLLPSSYLRLLPHHHDLSKCRSLALPHCPLRLRSRRQTWTMSTSSCQ